MTGGKCELCGFEGKVQKHHLIPQRVSRHRNRHLRQDPSNQIPVCDVCHRTIHAYYSEDELRDRLNTAESLVADERFAAYLKWRRRHMDFSSNSTKMSRSRRKS